MSYDHSWDRHAVIRLTDASSAAAAVLIAIEKGAWLGRDNLFMFDNAIRDLEEARRLFLAHRNEEDAAAKAKVAA